MQNQISKNPWDDGFQVNVKRFFYFQSQAFLFFAITFLLFFVWGVKQIQALLKKV